MGKLYVYNGSWHLVDDTDAGAHLYAYDGSNSVTGWRDIQVGYICRGNSVWEKFWEINITPTIDSSAAESDYDSDTSGFTDECDCQCDGVKTSHCICINYNVSDCLLAHHVQFQMSLNGTSWYEESEKACSNNPLSQFCQTTQDGGNTSGCSTSTRYARIRIHDDTTHTTRATGSTHGPYNPSGCGAA